MTEVNWLEYIFKLMIFDHALIALYLTAKFILWVSPKWWGKDND